MRSGSSALGQKQQRIDSLSLRVASAVACMHGVGCIYAGFEDAMFIGEGGAARSRAHDWLVEFQSNASGETALGVCSAILGRCCSAAQWSQNESLVAFYVCGVLADRARKRNVKVLEGSGAETLDFVLQCALTLCSGQSQHASFQALLARLAESYVSAFLRRAVHSRNPVWCEQAVGILCDLPFPEIAFGILECLPRELESFWNPCDDDFDAAASVVGEMKTVAIRRAISVLASSERVSFRACVWCLRCLQQWAECRIWTGGEGMCGIRFECIQNENIQLWQALIACFAKLVGGTHPVYTLVCSDDASRQRLLGLSLNVWASFCSCAAAGEEETHQAILREFVHACSSFSSIIPRYISLIKSINLLW